MGHISAQPTFSMKIVTGNEKMTPEKIPEMRKKAAIMPAVP